jgi:nucleotide-binding universal stress UspA family protein
MSTADETVEETDDVPVILADPLGEGGRVVVGVDESPHAQAALRWALREALLRGDALEVVHVWQPPVSSLPFGLTLSLSVDEGELDAAGRAELDKLVDAALAELGDDRPEVLRTVVPGPPAPTLIDIAADADLLVVGAQGRTGLRQVALGSVAHACVQHAACPVVVVRTAE